MSSRVCRQAERHAGIAGSHKLRVAITGASGLIGTRLASCLASAGHRVEALVRDRGRAGVGRIYWSPDTGEVDSGALEGVEAVVHLAGENIGAGRWTPDRKARVRASRVQGTRHLVKALVGLENKPGVLVAASAIGYYGARGDEPLREDSPPGKGFLADLCGEWEEATGEAARAGIRVVNLRIGVVLAAQGGALEAMLTPFKMGVGGRIGDGTQVMSWISLDDVVALAHHAVVTSTLAGPVNATAPEPVTNLEFTKTLGSVLRRPTLLPVPSLAIKALFGEMGDNLLLSGSRVLPARALESGFAFEHPTLESALRAALGR